MDARLRLNQIRKQNSRQKRKKLINKINMNPINNRNKKMNSLTDLRELIKNNSNNSVKNRIGFITNKKKINPKQTLISDNNRSKQNVKQIQNKRVRIIMSGDDERIPKVMVKLSQIKDNRNQLQTNQINTKTRNTPKSLSKRRFNTIASTQPIIIPQIVPQTSVPTYIMASSVPINRISNSRIDEYNETSDINTVLVTNLNKSITQQDINELFGEIGTLIKASKINPSVALIVYGNPVDARNACQTYHNRLLDGMPMQCNILSDSQNAYTMESIPRTQSSPYRRQSSGLLASQLRQINSQSSKMTAAQVFANNRKGSNSNVRFTVNV